MIYLLLSILCSTFIFIVFKMLERFKIDASKAIIINYITAFAIGFFLNQKPVEINEIVVSEWFYGGIVLGLMFIIIFNIMAMTAQKNGLSVASVASKMSVVIPVIFGIWLHKEAVSIPISIGIILALISVYLTASKGNTVSNLRKNLTLPIVLFIGSGAIDTMIKYFDTNYLGDDDIFIFSFTIFLFASVIGIVQLAIFKKLAFGFKTILGGIALGVVNFGSLYFIIKSLQLQGWSSATIFSLNNVGIVMLSTLVGYFFFKEKLLKKNWIGILIAVIAIVIITYSK